MPDEPLALVTVPPLAAATADYDAICATVMDSARGRWFLQEYARRNRNADTRLVLAAIARIEAVIRSQQSDQSLRIELLEMAKTIAVTRAEIAEIAPAAGREDAAAATAPAAPDVFAAAERVQEVVWTMRERGFEPATCDQIEALARSILANSALRDPNDRRARKLGEVLSYLGHRIEAMLDGRASPATIEHADAPADHGPAAAVNGHAAADRPATGGVVVEVHAAEEPAVAIDEALQPAAPDRTSADQASEAHVDEQAIDPSPAPPLAEVPAAPDGASQSEAGPARSVDDRPAAADLATELDEDLFATSPEEKTARPPGPTQAPAGAAAPTTAAGATLSPAAQPMLAPPPNDPLAALRALSDEERIALFT